MNSYLVHIRDVFGTEYNTFINAPDEETMKAILAVNKDTLLAVLQVEAIS